MLGVPGLMTPTAPATSRCQRPGAGIADDKAVYIHVPEMIRFYLGEEPMLQERADLALQRAERCATCSITSTNWWSRRSTARAATACWSARTPAARARRIRAAC
jgi:hypothetical protein